VGARAAWLCCEHPADDGYGPRSPFARLVAAEGQVLVLGAPLETITLLHHAEATARVPGKVTVTYRIPVAGEDGTVAEVRYTDIDTSGLALPYARLALQEDEFAVIAREALAEGIGTSGLVGEGESHLFPAAGLAAFAIAWMERHLG
jgi:aminoglycoside 3-N-acetyltransferase